MKSIQELYSEAHTFMTDGSRRAAAKNAWGIFTQQARFGPGDPTAGAFIWCASETDLLENLSAFCIYWCCTEPPGKGLRRIQKESQSLVKDYSRERISRSDLIFRINNLLIPAGMEMIWMGPFSDLLFSSAEIPRLTRLFCRRTLSDMEEHGIDPLNDAPLEPQYLNTFVECLGDFGLEGQGLV